MSASPLLDILDDIAMERLCRRYGGTCIILSAPILHRLRRIIGAAAAKQLARSALAGRRVYVVKQTPAMRRRLHDDIAAAPGSAAEVGRRYGIHPKTVRDIRRARRLTPPAG